MGDRSKFLLKRFTDLGIATSPQVNRILFKNQEFREYASVEYLIENNFITETEYLQFINIPICEKDEKGIVGNLNNAPTNNLVENGNDASPDANKGGGIETDNAIKKIQTGLVSLKNIVKDDENANLAINTIEDAVSKIQNDNNLDVKDQKYIKNKNFDFFKFNDKINVPFENPHFFNFLHFFKYTLSKGYSKFRMERIYRMLDGLMDVLSNTYYFEGKGIYKPEKYSFWGGDGPSDSIVNNDQNNTTFNNINFNNKYPDKKFYKHTFLYAYRRNFVNKFKKFTGIGYQKGDQELQVKNSCNEKDTKNEYFSSLSKLSANFEDKTENVENTFNETVSKVVNENDIHNKDDVNDNGNTISHTENAKVGGRRTQKNKYRILSNRSYHRKTKNKKLVGGFLLYTSRVYRALNMYISTTNIYNYGTSSGDVNLIIKGYNKLTSVEKADKIPVYVVKEQIRCLLLAYYYLTIEHNVVASKVKNLYYEHIKTKNTYDIMTEFINNTVIININKDKNTTIGDVIKILNDIDNSPNSIIDPISIIESKYHTFIKPDSNVHRTIKMFLRLVHSKVSWINFDMSFIKKIFRHSTNLAFVHYTENLLKDPIVDYPNLKTKLNTYYKLKGLTYENIDATANPTRYLYKKDSIDFLVNFTWCILTTPHFACSQISGFIAGFAITSGLKATELLEAFFIGSTSSNGGLMSTLARFTFVGMPVVASSITAMINTPNCLYSMSLVLYTLLLGLKPFMPQEGRAIYMPKSDRLNSFFYKPKSSIVNTMKAPFKHFLSGGKNRKYKTKRRNHKGVI